MRNIRWILFFIITLSTTIFGQQTAPPFITPVDYPTDTTAPSTEQDRSNLEELKQKEEAGMGRFLSEMFHMLLTLSLIIGAMLVGAWVLKRFLNTRIHQMNATSGIKILERRSLSPKSAVYLIDVYGKGIVIGESHAGIERIAEVELPPENGEIDKPERKSSFGQIYKDKMNQ